MTRIIRNYDKGMGQTVDSVRSEDRFVGVDFRLTHYLVNECDMTEAASRGAITGFITLDGSEVPVGQPGSVYRLVGYSVGDMNAVVVEERDEFLIRKVMEGVHESFSGVVEKS